MSEISEIQERLEATIQRGRKLGEQMESLVSEMLQASEEVQEIGGREEATMTEALENARTACVSAQDGLDEMSTKADQYMQSL